MPYRNWLVAVSILCVLPAATATAAPVSKVRRHAVPRHGAPHPHTVSLKTLVAPNARAFPAPGKPPHRPVITPTTLGTPLGVLGIMSSPSSAPQQGTKGGRARRATGSRAIAHAAAAVNPNGTYNETTGGNANTWTNYTNAGGNAGPVISAYATVEIACVVQGFAVANGNRNWYLIASMPWSYQYYVSADAFYNNGQTSGTLLGTPYVDPSVPSCGSGGGVPETAGGAANTWTNYTNAGGQQGPTVGGGATIGIACKLQGFRVADGNTWWYRIAQTPWNGAYYVSADAFYNNGATSGSLLGTPYVDPNVPDCVPPSTPPPGGKVETVGGDAHTWSNPANAGGTQGPTIPGGASVAIACKLSGFRVANGNTWWYQVASSPYTGFYVSADAFYNNGATSGSLLGTPYVDYEVPDCVANAGAPRPLTETAGGDADTFGNYSHAGVPGPYRVPRGGTISVTCRAQGFRVADGNTWWYLIASAPWNNVYYVSADAFYNNGQTSGSLQGTPFYDPSVPVCVNNVQAPLGTTSLALARSSSNSPTCVYGAYPVNCASGDFWHEFSDIAVSGRGPGLGLSRTYNSLAIAPGLFGYGWSSSYGQHLELTGPDRSDGSIAVALEDGTQILATPDGSGGYTTPAASDSSFRRNADTTFTLVRHHRTLKTFSASGQLLSLSDLNGYATTLGYDAAGHLARVTDAAGRQITLATDAEGRVMSATDPLGRVTAYSYDTAGNLTSVTAPLGRVTTFGYDAEHHMLTMTFPGGGSVQNTYDDQGRVTQQIDPAGLTTAFAYVGDSFGSQGGTTTITDPHGVVRLERYVNGFLTQVTKAVGTDAEGTWSFTYDPDTWGQTSATDPNGRVTTRTFDAAGRLTSTTDPLGHTWSSTYNNLGEETAATTPSGLTTNATYDAAGNQLTTTDAAGKTTTKSYADPSRPGDLTSITDPDGRVVRIGFDGYGNLASKTIEPSPGRLLTTRFVYNAGGEQLCTAPANAVDAGVTCPAPGASRVGGTITRKYDDAGRLTSLTDAAGHTSSYTYDRDDNQVTATDANGRVKRSTYDGNGRVLTSETSASASSVSVASYGYDRAPGTANCPLAAAYCNTVTSPEGRTVIYAFDAQDLQIARRRPGGQSLQYSFDAAGVRQSRTDARGHVTTYDHDAAGRLTSISYADGVTPNVSYQLDADGRRTSMTDGSGTTNYTYDDAGRPTTVVNGAGAAVSYAYNGRGDVTELTYPSGKKVTRAYDGANRMVSVTDWQGGTTRFAYDPDGDLTTTKYPNGDTVVATYDKAAQATGTSLLSPTNTILAAIAYTRSASDLLTNEADSGALAASQSFSYDGRAQLLSGGSASFGYDKSGNLTKSSGSVQTFDALDQLTTTSLSMGATYDYDQDGNRTQVTPAFGRPAKARFDGENRLLSTAVEPVRPTIDRLSATSGSTTGGTTVSISGTGLSEVTSVMFGDVPATAVSMTADTRLSVVVPTHAAGAVDVTVRGPGGESAVTSVDRYTYKNLPGVTSVYPTAGPRAGATTVTLQGEGFTGVTKVTFGAVAASFKIVSSTKLAVVAPPGSGLTAISVTNSSGTSAATPASRYTYADGPAVTSVSPAQSPLSGKSLTILGAGFTNASAVSFGSAAATTYTVASDTRIVATAPPGTGAVDVTVVTPAGTSSSTTADVFTYLPVPTVTGIAPVTGATAGGTLIRVTGTGFVEGASVLVGGIKSPTRVLSETAALAVAPAGTSVHEVKVATAGGVSVASAATRYTYAPAVEAYAYNGGSLRTSTTADGVAKQFTWDTVGAVPLVLDDSNNTYIYGPDGAPIVQIDSSGARSYFFHDATGSTRALTGQSGAITATFSYTPYGALKASTGSALTPLLFAGSYRDRDTGLNYLINRYYDSQTGQFLSIDPAFDSTDSAYGYAAGDPVNRVDPLGLFPWKSLASGIALVGGAAVSIVGCAAGGCLVAAAGAATIGVASGVSTIMLGCWGPNDDCGGAVVEGMISIAAAGWGVGGSLIKKVGSKIVTRAANAAGELLEATSQILDLRSIVTGNNVNLAAPASTPAPTGAPGPIAQFSICSFGQALGTSTSNPQTTYNPQPQTYNPQQGGGALPFGAIITSVGVAHPPRLVSR